MGMYDDIKLEINCPYCGKKVSGFQSKSGPCMLLELEYWEVPNFYTACPHCGKWIEYSRKVTPPRIPLSDYELVSK